MKAALAFLCLTITAHAASLDEPTHVEVTPIKFDIGGDDGHLKTIAMDPKGNLLVGVSYIPKSAGAGSGQNLTERLRAASKSGDAKAWDRVLNEASAEDIRDAMMAADEATRSDLMQALGEPKRNQVRELMRGGSAGSSGDTAYALKVVSPEGKVLSTWPMQDGLQPKMIHGCDDGLVYVAGGGKMAAFTAEGKLLKMIDTDAVSGQQATAAGIYVTQTHVFLALGVGNSLRATEDVWRFKRDLSEPKRIIERLFGCCSHIDIEVTAKEILIGENSRHRVNRYDLDGKQTGTWGKRDRTSLEGFTACCNPCNHDIGPGGVFYAAESGVGRVKKYSTDGKYLGLVGYVDTTKFDGGSALAAASCYIPIEVNADASRIYVMDVRAQIIRVLEKKS